MVTNFFLQIIIVEAFVVNRKLKMKNQMNEIENGDRKLQRPYVKLNETQNLFESVIIPYGSWEVSLQILSTTSSQFA